MIEYRIKEPNILIKCLKSLCIGGEELLKAARSYVRSKMNEMMIEKKSLDFAGAKAGLVVMDVGEAVKALGDKRAEAIKDASALKKAEKSHKKGKVAFRRARSLLQKALELQSSEERMSPDTALEIRGLIQLGRKNLDLAGKQFSVAGSRVDHGQGQSLIVFELSTGWESSTIIDVGCNDLYTLL